MVKKQDVSGTAGLRELNLKTINCPVSGRVVFGVSIDCLLLVIQN